MGSADRLIVFSGVRHYWCANGYVAHGGFVREVDVWARVFRSVVVVCPVVRDGGARAADCVQYEEPNIEVVSLGSPVETTGVRGKLRLLGQAPHWVRTASAVIHNGDVLMARGPDSVGFLGAVVGRTRKVKRFAKYADQWTPFAGEPWGYRLQKLVYGSRVFGGPVQIYGEPDSRRPHLVTFVPSTLSEMEWRAAGELVARRQPPPPFRLLFVGRLVPAKGADVLLEAVHRTHREGRCGVQLDIVGDGPERARLVDLAAALGIARAVRFRGWVGWGELSGLYAQAHCFIHASRKEGFGKVLIEALAHQLPVVATDVGVSRLILEAPRYGFIIPPNDSGALAEGIARVIRDPEAAAAVARQGRERARDFLLERFAERCEELVRVHLGLDVNRARVQ